MFLQKQVQNDVELKLINPNLPVYQKSELLSQIHIFSFTDMMRNMLKIYQDFCGFVVKTLLLNIISQELLGVQFEKMSMLLLLL